ncbi:MAG TPA: alpha/beta fold hydrolase [Arenicellales bacterium]|nr:alpha/beta fold hydrolase [Arenicellales bacterium]
MSADLVLLHGWAMTRRVWNPVIAGLEAHFTVHNIGLPGHEDPDPDSAQYGDMPAAWILDRWSDVLLERAPGGALWVGWSLGATVVMNAMRRRPGAIRAALLVSATPRFLRGRDWDAAVDNDVMRGFLQAMRANDEKTLRRFALLQAEDRRAVRAISNAVAGDADRPALEAGLRVLEETDLRPDLHELSVAVRVVHGFRDRVVPHAAGERLAAALPRADLVSLDAGHAPFIERPEEFIEAVTTWQ